MDETIGDVMRMQICPFCNPEIIGRQTFGSSKHFLFFYNHKPVLPGHSLIVPKRHVETILDMTDEELREFAVLMKRLAGVLMGAYGCDGVDMSLQSGVTAGASIAHIHWHIVPRKAGDIEGDPSMWMAKIIESERARTAISDEEIQKNIWKIREVMGK